MYGVNFQDPPGSSMFRFPSLVAYHYDHYECASLGTADILCECFNSGHIRS